MQLRMSPGGSMLNSLRRRPLDPPSSLTVTTAQRSRIASEPGCAERISSGVRTKRLSPLRSVESPVPPPMATTRRPRVRPVFSSGRSSTVLESIGRSLDARLGGLGFRAIHVGGAKFRAGIGVEQLGEARIFCQILEIGIVARLETELWIQTQSLVQPLQRILDMAGQAIQRCQAIDDVVRLSILLQQFVEMLSGGDVIAQVHERNGIVIVLLGGLELCRRGPLQMLIAGVEVHVGAVGEFLAGSGDDLLEMRLGLVELVFLHGAEACFVALQRLGVARVFRHGLLCAGFLSHVQNSSCALGNKRLLSVTLVLSNKVSLKGRVEGNGSEISPECRAPSYEKRSPGLFPRFSQPGR